MRPYLKKKPGRQRTNGFGETEFYWLIGYRMPDGEKREVTVGWHTEDGAREARAEARAAHKRGEDPYPNTVPVGSGIAAYLRYLGTLRPDIGTPRNRQSTIDDKEQVLGFFSAWLRIKFPMVETVAELHPVHLDAFMEDRRQDASSRTIAKNQSYIEHWLKWCRKQKYTTVDFPKWERLPQKKKPKRYLDESAQAAVLEAFEPELRMAWLFVLSTGCRPGEMFALNLSDLRPGERVALFEDTKNNDPRPVVYTPALAEYLAELLASVGVGAFLQRKRPEWAAPVFRHPKTHKRLDRQSWRRAVYRAMDTAEVERVKPYGSRHTFITERLNRGVAKHQLRDATGQRTTAVIDDYSLTTPVTVKAAFDAVDADRLLGTKRGPNGGGDVVTFEDRKRKRG